MSVHFDQLIDGFFQLFPGIGNGDAQQFSRAFETIEVIFHEDRYAFKGYEIVENPIATKNTCVIDWEFNFLLWKKHAIIKLYCHVYPFKYVRQKCE